MSETENNILSSENNILSSEILNIQNVGDTFEELREKKPNEVIELPKLLELKSELPPLKNELITELNNIIPDDEPDKKKRKKMLNRMSYLRKKLKTTTGHTITLEKTPSIKKVIKGLPKTDKATYILQINKLCDILKINKESLKLNNMSLSELDNKRIELIGQTAQIFENSSLSAVDILLTGAGVIEKLSPITKEYANISFDGYFLRLAKRRQELQSVLNQILKDNPEMLIHCSPMTRLALILGSEALTCTLENHMKPIK